MSRLGVDGAKDVAEPWFSRMFVSYLPYQVNILLFLFTIDSTYSNYNNRQFYAFLMLTQMKETKYYTKQGWQS